MRITQLDVEIGEAARVHLVGLTKTGKVHGIENIELEVSQNPERFSVELDGDVAVVTALKLPGDDPVPAAEEGGEPTPGVQDGDASLLGRLTVRADGRIGDGVRAIEKSLPLVAHTADAVDIAFEVEDAPAVE